ncbi:hypothetical protein F8388_021835 [Cannabis sativa]|uniref:Zinc knuckle CX2CX4HX4C domain-containing protein n=1 Tax=Cannabis sativa TaxID=3483 RepID=A0A7J6E2L7_CANSA|nr:hypothetical protein F8388_021835 [Cannabis sativa]
MFDFCLKDLSTFCFICGVLGHSEKLCDTNFTTPAHLITKHYGLEMKAESRHRRQHTIRAKWFCDSSSSAGGFSGSQGGGGLREQDSNVNDQSMEEDQELIRNGKGKIIVDSEIMGGVNVISSNIYIWQVMVTI